MVMEMVEMMIEGEIFVSWYFVNDDCFFYLDVHVVVHVIGNISSLIVAIRLFYSFFSHSRSRSSSRERSKKKYVWIFIRCLVQLEILV
jgi:hypothetical protein